MKFKFRNLLIGTGIALLGVAAVGAAVGISEKKADKPDTSDTVSENLDLINLIGDLQSQINSVNTENEQIKSQLNSVKNENNNLKNQLNSIFDSSIEVNGNITATEGLFDSIQVGSTQFTESDLDRHLFSHKIFLSGTADTGSNFYSTFTVYSCDDRYYDSSTKTYDVESILYLISSNESIGNIKWTDSTGDYNNPTCISGYYYDVDNNTIDLELNCFNSKNFDYDSYNITLTKYEILDYAIQIF